MKERIIFAIGLFLSYILFLAIGLSNAPVRVEYIEKEKIVEVEKEIYVSNEDYMFIGEFELTAYCPCVKCSEGYGSQTATGNIATAEHTIAVDPNVIPYGSIVFINGKEYVAEDCGGAIKDKAIDIFFDTHEEALQFGRQKANVFIKK